MKKRKNNNFLLTDNQMAEFVSKGYLIFDKLILSYNPLLYYL